MPLEANVGDADRFVRVAVGAVLLVLGILGYAGTIPAAVGPLPGAFTSLVLVLAGAVLAVTGLLGTCPVYAGLDWSTVRR